MIDLSELPDTPILNPVSVYSLIVLASFAVLGCFVAFKFLRKNATTYDRITLTWLIFNVMTRCIFEASWVYYSTFGRTVATSSGIMVHVWKDYSKADYRWLVNDPVFLAFEFVVIGLTGPAIFYIIYQIFVDDPTRHFWIVFVCIIEDFALWMIVIPEWLTGNQNLNPANFLFRWVYIFFLNAIYGVMATWMTYVSGRIIIRSLKTAAVVSTANKAR
ncbi:hypothetical protein BOTBODRAFT_29758 [Botryobasidium botryosum FD-172 SS1]|uniref:EXPERA domain-containing protein n=1 Tax=Botryobasidium botryosum (strain FD-172 SS1) TaxID=930990 RepID=A0A067MP90_BOTB1|nr:hypothetical protein BOTBODRAFT_29758 [Botryobasidium botryosum FD-172 SS1]